MNATQKEKGIHCLRFDRGDEVYSGITEYCKELQVTNATVSAIGALAGVELGFYYISQKEYAWKTFSEDHELVSGTGNITLKDGMPFLHMHVVISDKEFRAYGGHFKKGFAGATCEVIIAEIVSDSPLARKMDEGIGLALWDI